MEARRDFFLIFKEAVNNAAKYSKSEIVKISLLINNKQLTLEVIDDGEGFDVAHADSGNGLSNMQKELMLCREDCRLLQKRKWYYCKTCCAIQINNNYE